MNERIYELDRQGDITFLIYDVPESLPQTLDQLHPLFLDGSIPKSTSPAAEGDETNQTPQAVLKIRASSKHLTLACPQFARTLHSDFQESQDLHQKGHLDLEIDNWDPAAFPILMLILHGRTRPVPRKLTLSKFVDFAVLVDYYECYEAVEVFTDMWIRSLKKTATASMSLAQVEEWLFVSWVFQHRQSFALACGYLRGNLTSRFCPELPVPQRVCDAIDRAREDAISRILDRLHGRVAVLRSDKVQCSYECDCVLLGALTRHMHRLGILERPAPPFEGIAVEQLAGVVVPRWYERGGEIQHSCLATLDFNSSLRGSGDALKVVDLDQLTELRRKRLCLYANYNVIWNRGCVRILAPNMLTPNFQNSIGHKHIASAINASTEFPHPSPSDSYIDGPASGSTAPINDRRTVLAAVTEAHVPIRRHEDGHEPNGKDVCPEDRHDPVHPCLGGPAPRGDELASEQHGREPGLRGEAAASGVGGGDAVGHNAVDDKADDAADAEAQVGEAGRAGGEAVLSFEDGDGGEYEVAVAVARFLLDRPVEGIGDTIGAIPTDQIRVFSGKIMLIL
ncbi:hypothetical protein Aspvir_003684 [Aspergillus viridinutans]|uniref:BTB domain-containing protein n=1 Tax=Aspergillus viridinutans TaxID=75553 RepID=A0A9P3EZV8_ASPVI|nr:uncharacterized protein Aspvir_003684 [Aspergillus viridinutans]GIJ99683.1 hypothetical protein Aspvir_003684 [Aspergillus viridinutans]